MTIIMMQSRRRSEKNTKEKKKKRTKQIASPPFSIDTKIGREGKGTKNGLNERKI